MIQQISFLKQIPAKVKICKSLNSLKILVTDLNTRLGIIHWNEPWLKRKNCQFNNERGCKTPSRRQATMHNGKKRYMFPVNCHWNLSQILNNINIRIQNKLGPQKRKIYCKTTNNIKVSVYTTQIHLHKRNSKKNKNKWVETEKYFALNYKDTNVCNFIR